MFSFGVLVLDFYIILVVAMYLIECMMGCVCSVTSVFIFKEEENGCNLLDFVVLFWSPFSPQS